MTRTSIKVTGTASIDGTAVTSALVNAASIDEIRSDGPVAIDIETDYRPLEAVIQELARECDSNQELLDRLAIEVAGIDFEEWMEIRPVAGRPRKIAEYIDESERR